MGWEPQRNCGQGGISVRGHPCPHVPNSLPRQPQSPHNDSLNDSPHIHARASTMKALQKAREGNAGEGAGAPRVPRSSEIWAV